MNPSLTQDQFMSTLRYVAFAGGMWLVDHKYLSAEGVNTLLATVLIIGPMAWAYLNNWLKNHKVAAQNAAAVEAGIQLVMQNKAIASDGTTIVIAGQGATPPKPVTVQSAAQIIKDFAPNPAEVAKS